MNKQRTWIDYIADVLSGRLYNTLMALNTRLKKQENDMSTTQDKINAIADELTQTGVEMDEGLASLRQQLADAGVSHDEVDLTALESIADKLKGTADGLVQAAPSLTNEDPFTSGASPIQHGENVPTPLAGDSGPTDAGAPTEVPAPGTQPQGNAAPFPAVEEEETPAHEAEPTQEVPSEGTATGSDTSSTGTTEADTSTQPTDANQPTGGGSAPVSGSGDEGGDF